MSEQHTPMPWEDAKCIERFWSKVEIAGADDCWIWKRGVSGFGYGNFHYGKMSIRAHRFSYQLHHGKIRKEDCVCHSCDNPKCVNPAHLWIGTRAENNADKEAKGRAIHPKQKSGEANSHAILSTPEVVAARVMARHGMPQARIASYLGVSNSLLCLIINGERRVSETESRVSACVDACEGIPTKWMEENGIGCIDAMHVTVTSGRKLIEQQRDQLLTALKLAVSEAVADPLDDWYVNAQSVIAAVEGKE